MHHCGIGLEPPQRIACRLTIHRDFFLALHLLCLSSLVLPGRDHAGFCVAQRGRWRLSFHKCGREETDMTGESIRRVAAIGTGTIGASWTAVFLARGLTAAASDPAPGAETFLREFVAAAWPSLARLSPLPADPPWAALSFHTEPEAAVVGAEFIQESAPEREELKRALLARLDAVLDPEIVIASSSSGLLMSRVQIDCRHRNAASSATRSIPRIWCRWSRWLAARRPVPRRSSGRSPSTPQSASSRDPHPP